MNRTPSAFPAGSGLSNAELLPALQKDEDTALVQADSENRLLSPEWVGSLVLMEIHPETATGEGTLASLLPVLDHCAALGVNGVWLTPVYDPGPDGNGYTNLGPDTLNPALTGTRDAEEGWAALRSFVEEAHGRRIRVFLDIVSWGCSWHSPLLKRHPEWFRGEAWGGAAFNWDHPQLREWFAGVCVRNILVTGADGYRCDCEPSYSGFRVFSEVKSRLLSLGRKIALISEESAERGGVYDFEQDGVTEMTGGRTRGEQCTDPKAYFLGEYNLVDAVKSGAIHGSPAAQAAGTSGRYRFYTYCVSHHDYLRPLVGGNRLVIGYQAIFAPYLPMWYLGSEFGMRSPQGKVLYEVPVDWSLLEETENREFCGDVARYLRIRRSYPEIFCCWPPDHRNANICKIDAGTRLQSYARFAGGSAVLVIPNDGKSESQFRVRAQACALGLGGAGACRLTDLLAGGAPGRCEKRDGVFSFSARVGAERLGVYLLEAI